MIQEVVGSRVGKYFFPTFAGVAFSNNEFRWSARIKRDDGLVRMVPGLGTRAVDRVGDDYPVLDRAGTTRPEGERHARRSRPLLAGEDGRHQPGVGTLRDGALEGHPRRVRRGDSRHSAPSLARGRRRDPSARPDRLGIRRGPARGHLRRAQHIHPFHCPDARAAAPPQGEDGKARGHRVRLGRQGSLPAAVPAAELLATTPPRRRSRATFRPTG